MTRKVSFAQACAQFVHRFTCDHIPAHVRKPHVNPANPEKDGLFYAPQWASDREWYDATTFPGEPGLHGNSNHCETGTPTRPLGKGFLREPFHKNPNQTAVA